MNAYNYSFGITKEVTHANLLTFALLTAFTSEYVRIAADGACGVVNWELVSGGAVDDVFWKVL